MNFSEVQKIVRGNRYLIKKLLTLFAVLVVFDQVTKLIAQAYLENSPEIILIPRYLGLFFLKNHITRVYQYIVYFLLNIAVMPPLLIYLIEEKYNKTILVGMVFLWSAIFSNNLLDVFVLGYIRDFINLHGVAVGNIADQYRNAGGILIIIGLIIGKTKLKGYKAFLFAGSLVILFLILMMLFWKYLSPYMAI